MKDLPLFPSRNQPSSALGAVPLVCVMLLVGALLVGAVPDLDGQAGTNIGEWGQTRMALPPFT
jgi:hypothetical protein